VALAQNARQLTSHPVLSGWLHRTAQNLAANTVRSDVRRRAREQEAVAMNELLAPEPEAIWKHIAPQLDAALGELNEPDRDALLLRYFERKSAREMAQTLGTTEDAAQKRVSRAVERLREFLSKHGVTVGASGLVVVISANAVQAAPIGLAVTISTAAIFAGKTITSAATATAIKTIVMTTLQKTLITATLAVVAGAGIYEAHQASTLRSQVQTLQQQQTPLAEQLAKLQAENKQLSNLVAQAKDQKSLSQAQLNELLKLRGQAGQAQTAVQQLAKLKASSAQQNGTMPAYFTNAMAQGVAMAEKFKKKDALAKLARMKAALQLTDDQEQSISNILIKNIENGSQQVLNAMQGKQQDPATLSASQNEEAAIKALLTPDQLAAYPDFKQAEVTVSASNSAKGELAMMAGEMDLSQEQQDKIQAALYQYDLNQTSASENNKDAIAQARASGNFANALSLQVERQKQALEDKLKILGEILTPEQLKTYQQKQLDIIDMQISATKMFLPQSTNAVPQ